MRGFGKIIFLVFLLLVIYISAYLIDRALYRSTDILKCTKEQEIKISRSSWPVLSNFDFTNGLEVYVGGWIEAGTVTISSEVFDFSGEENFSASSSLAEVSKARIGEWYTDTFTVDIKPSSDASCAVRIIYKFRGI